MGNITGFLEHIFLLFLLIHHCVGPPTKKQEAGDPAKADDQKANLDDFGLEYNRYLTEVVNALESDPEFRKKLETAQEADFRNGKVAAELEYVNHHVRTKLDELKRVELQRLRDLVHQAEEVEQNNVNPNHVNPGHVDHTNPHSFEAADLHKLITQVRHDLAELDKKRRDEFKEYEMQKKFEQEQKIKTMDEEHKKQYLHELEEQKKKHQKHEPLHHPGSRAQLEEVWEKEDHMKNQQFNPKAFFMMHDVNGDGYWDEEEVKALFVKDLDKLYEAGASEDDMREREEEMERMREHVFKEADTNRDRLLSYDEFLAQTKRDEFNRDEGWETIDSQPQYTQQEYEEFERRRQEEIQRLIDQGLLRPYAPGMVAPPGYEPHPGQFQQPYGQPGMNQHLPPQAHGQGYQGYHPQQGQQFHPQQGQPIHHQQGQPMHPQQGQPMHPQQAQQFHAQQGQYHPQQGQQFHPQQGQVHPQQGQQFHPQQGQPIHPPQGNQYPPQMQPYAGQQQYPNQPHPPSPQGSQGQQASILNHPSEPNKPSNNQQLPNQPAQGTGANPVPANAQPAYGQNGQPQYHDPNQVVPQSANSNNQAGQQAPSVNQGSNQQYNQVPQVRAGQQPVPGNIPAQQPPAQPASYQQGNAGSQNQIHSDSGKIHNTKN